MSKKTVKITAEGVKGAEDGQNTKPYEKDEVYSVSAELADVWIKGGLAEETKAKPTAKPDSAEEKSVEKSPENKAVESAPENKSGSDKKAGKKK